MLDCFIKRFLILGKHCQSTVFSKQTAIEIRFELIRADLSTVYEPKQHTIREYRFINIRDIERERKSAITRFMHEPDC